MPRKAKNKDPEEIGGSRVPNLRSSIFLSEADGLWHGFVTMGVKADGSPDRRHRKRKTEAAVTEAVRKLEAQRDAGRPSKPGRAPTLEEWMTEYLGPICELLVRNGKLAPRTLDDYRSKNRNWIIPHLGKHRLDMLLPEHLEVAYFAMYEAGLKSSTVLKIHRIIGRALTIAVRRDKVGRNVTKLIEAPEPSEFELSPPTQDEARRLVDAAQERRNGCRWLHAFASADRQGECLGLRWHSTSIWRPALSTRRGRYSGCRGAMVATTPTSAANGGTRRHVTPVAGTTSTSPHVRVTARGQVTSAGSAAA